MNTKRLIKYTGITLFLLVLASCKVPFEVAKTEAKLPPEKFGDSINSANSGKVKWKQYFTDPNLISLIDSALVNNQELNIALQEINIAKAEVKGRKGEYLPFVNLQGGAGFDKVGRYTRNGALEANNDIAPGKEFPEPFPDYMLSANISWELDIWRKLRNAKDAATKRFLATIEGRNFTVTRLVSEIASSYYELLALDNKLDILNQNIEIQKSALQIVNLQKNAGMETELAVRKFEAEVLKNQSRLYYIQQRIIETENRINFLVGRYPRPIVRDAKHFYNLVPDAVHVGLPADLLMNRPDVKKAELELSAAKLDVKSAKANFYPSLSLRAGSGFQAFDSSYLLNTPKSLIYGLAGDLIAPLINRNAIKAKYYSATAKQIQAVYNYEQTIINAYTEVVNQMANVNNLNKSYDFKTQQVKALTRSITVSVNLFKSARADYMEVLMTQRDALDAKIELVETKQQQLSNWVNIYRSLGGGWQ